MGPLEEARNPDGSRRFYPPGEHPTTYRLRRQRELLESQSRSLEGGVSSMASIHVALDYIERQLAYFEMGEDEAKRLYLAAATSPPTDLRVPQRRR